MQYLVIILVVCFFAFALISLVLWQKYRSEQTARERTERESGNSRDWLDLIQTKTPVMIHVIDGNGCLVAVSDEWLERLGYTRQEVLGKQFTAFLPAESSWQCPGDDCPECSCTGLCKEIPLQIVKHDGQILDVLFSAVAERNLKGGLFQSFAILTDITVQKQATVELKQAQDELEERVRNRTLALDEAYEHLALEMKERKRAEIILHTIAEGVSGTTGVAFFTSLVKYLSKVLNMDHAMIGIFDEQEEDKVQTVAISSHGQRQENFSYDLAGTPCAKVTSQGMCLYPQNVAQLFPEDSMLLSMGIESYIGTLLNDSSGTPIGLLVVMGSSPVETSGTVTSMLQIFASRVAAELERLKQDDELMQVRNLESLGRMAAGIAHEVNNPLTNASINIQMLRKKLDPLEKENPLLRRVEAVERNIERASNIAKELLLFSRQQELELVQVDLVDIVDKAFAQMTCELEHIVLHRKMLLVTKVLGDPLKLEGVFINLFNNAIDAMPNGGTLSVSSFEESGKIIVKVHDTGCGIPQEYLSKVFDPFFTTKEVGVGTGLGLSIVYGIIRQHHGMIEVISSINEGTTFIVKLPIQ